jgi:cobalt/nickel transport system permease protein
MHMADALISPAVGVSMWAVTAGAAAYSIRKIQKDPDPKKVPFMGVMGAFVFAAQMVNFSIPGTGSSGHLGGGLLLAIMLGPYAGFLTMASILIIQALFFADGGLLALGSNVFNLGFFTCFVAYPLIFKKITGNKFSSKRIMSASLLASAIGLQLGAFSVVLETLLSGRTELPFGTFVLLMQPIHLAIGIVEGLVTAAVVSFVWKARPEVIENSLNGRSFEMVPVRKVLAVIGAAAIITGVILSWFASSHPDGLEWSMFRTSGKEELEQSGKVHEKLAAVQEKTAFLPDYSLKSTEPRKEETTEKWPAVNGGTSLSGLVGGSLTLVLAGLMGFVINIAGKYKSSKADNNSALE